MANIAKIFVIIVTYKGHRWYERCFTSLRESEYPVQTIVIDNASNDGTIEYIREYFPEIHLIESKENLGFGRANNIGMSYALDNGCDYVFLLNQDAWVEPNTLTKLVDIHNSFPEYGILSPMHLTADKKHIESGLLSYIANCKFTDPTFVQDLYFNSLKEVYISNYINAAAWLLPRDTLENIGGFCPLIYHYGEDDDYMNRIHYHDLKLGLVPLARVVHDTTTRLFDSISLFERANREEMDKFLDITQEKSLFKQQCYSLLKYFIAILKGDTKSGKYYSNRYNTILLHKKEIEKCREQHKIKQANWL